MLRFGSLVGHCNFLTTQRYSISITRSISQDYKAERISAIVFRQFGTKPMEKNNYILLKNLITTYRIAYDKGEPLISDQGYDTLYQDLLDTEKQNPEFCDDSSPTQQVSPILEDNITKRRHHLPMLGLQNTYNNDQITKFESRILREVSSRDVSDIPIEYITEMKYDGMAVSMIFKEGKFLYAISRGDGLYGEDMTRNFLTHVNNLPFVSINSQRTLRVPHTDDIVEIRGEIVCSTQEFNEINSKRKQEGLKGFSTARNLATGTINKTETVDTETSLDMICYSLHIYQEKKTLNISSIDDLEQSVQWSNSQPSTQWDSLQKLREWNFPICPRAAKYNSMSDVFNYIHKHETPEAQKKFPYTTDGAVIKVNSIHQQFALGRIARSYRWAIAYKFPTDIHVTKLLDIQFQVGRTGKATPVAYLEKVLIDGSNVSRATLHNPSFIEQHKIEIGDLVKVEKSGGTIPKISGLANPDEKQANTTGAQLRLVCPCEKQVPLVKHDDFVDLFCSDDNCTEKKMRGILHFAKTLKIMGLGEAIVVLMINQGFVDSIADIFTLYEHREEILDLPRMGVKKVDNLLRNIEEAKNAATLPKILFALAIPSVGDTLCKQLSKQYKTLSNLAIKTETQLLADGFAAGVAGHVSRFFADPNNQNLLKNLRNCGLIS